jgi:(5-formylfuran-3-yl)methyl phosphate transaminase
VETGSTAAPTQGCGAAPAPAQSCGAPAPAQACGSPQPAGRSCMGIVDEAARLERSGYPVVHLEKGELDLDTPEAVKEAAIEALRANRTRYSHSTGLPEFRQAICRYYGETYGVDVDPARVIVNAGSSSSILELFLALLEPGDEVILPDPGYPAYPSFVEAARGRVVRAGSAESGFLHTAQLCERHLTPATKAVLINFPSNPVGAVATPDELRAFGELGPLVVADEVYHGLEFDGVRSRSILEFTDNAVAIGSFSKAFAMTGWRLGYAIVPEWLRARMTRLHEYLFVGTNTFAQWGAVVALDQAASIQRQLREELQRRLDCLLGALPACGLEPVYQPRGGFYVLVRQPEGTGTSGAFAAELLDRTHVALTPGSEFGPSSAGCIRFSLSAPSDQIINGLQRIAGFLGGSATRPELKEALT